MAYLKIDLDNKFDITKFSIDDYINKEAKISNVSVHSFKIKTSDGFTIKVNGEDFGPSQKFPFVKGTVETFESLLGKEKIFKITELSFDLQDFKHWGVKYIFAGDDKMTGSNFKDYLRGYGGNDELRGYDGNDTLRGDGGKDTLKGGDGKDKLTGGAGSDKFFFDTNPDPKFNFDRITDFEQGKDKIVLENRAYHGMHLGENDALQEKYFADYSVRDTDTKARIFYDSANGDLYYDRDGAKTKYEIIKFAHLDANPDDQTPIALAASDFLLV